MNYYCEKNEGKPGRCRKRARFIVLYKSQFGYAAGPGGAVPLYVVRGSYRCDDHKGLEDWRKPVETRPYPGTKAR